MRIVFLGTPEFAVPSLRALVSARHQVLAVFTQPDRGKGRGNKPAQSPVKRVALEIGLPVHQPERIRRPEALQLLQSLAADLMVVVGYGQIIPQSIIDLPRHGILNVHASLLPKYRGAAPVQWAIANGETETGITIMQIDAGLDTGDMLLKRRISIGEDETAPELSARLAPIGAELLLQAIEQITNGTVTREKQDDSAATYAPILKKEDGLIDWSLDASHIYNRMRGFAPWPGAYTAFRAQHALLLSAKPVKNRLLSPGAITAENRHLYVGCGDNTALEILALQLAGKTPVSAQTFLNGYKLAQNEMLGAHT